MWRAIVAGGLMLTCACGAPPADAPDLDATVRVLDLELFVSNPTDQRWRNCTVELNNGAWGRGVDEIASGGFDILPLATFTKRDGTRFDVLTTAVREIAVECDTPGGRAYGFYEWRGG